MSMVLDLREMRGFGDKIKRTYPAIAFPAEKTDDYAVVAEVTLSLRVHKDGECYRLVGGVRTQIGLSCCRCLDLFKVVRDIGVDLLYLPQTANRGEVESEISDEDLSKAFYRDDHIDLAHLVREQLQLSVPMKPLCQDDCFGLCPTCGVNRNTGQCRCDTLWRDPRLAVLETFLPDRKRE